MTLDVFVYDPSADPDDLDAKFIMPAGGEDYRHLLWGTDAIRSRAPLLARIAEDLYVRPEEFDDFERQCHLIAASADDVAGELPPRVRHTFKSLIGLAPPKHEQMIPADDIRQYMKYFLAAVEFARTKGSKEIHIG